MKSNSEFYCAMLVMVLLISIIGFACFRQIQAADYWKGKYYEVINAKAEIRAPGEHTRHFHPPLIKKPLHR